MAELSDRTIPYEILIRFDQQGEVQGAHYVTRRIVELDGERLKDEIGAARSISLVDDDSGRIVLANVLGEALSMALGTADRLGIALDEREGELEKLGSEMAELASLLDARERPAGPSAEES